MFELLFKYKNQEELNSMIFENEDQLYSFIKTEDIEVEQVVDKRSS